MAKTPLEKLIDAAEWARIQLATMDGLYAAEFDLQKREQLGAKGKKVEFRIDNRRYIKMLDHALAGMEKSTRKTKA